MVTLFFNDSSAICKNINEIASNPKLLEGDELKRLLISLVKYIEAFADSRNFEEKYFNKEEAKRFICAIYKCMPYEEYLKTNHWGSMRRKTLDDFRGKCAVCNSVNELEVHHRTYENIGAEQFGDLIPLCSDCHELFHKHKKLARR